MATNALLTKIRIDGVMQDLLTKSDQENVAVTYNGSNTTLANALTEIFTTVSGLPTVAAMNTAISGAVSDLIGGAPETYDTLKEIADYISQHQDVVTALDNAIGKKVDKEEGKGLSTEDFTTAFKASLTNLDSLGLTSERIAIWDAKADKTKATSATDGLMSKEDKARLDATGVIWTTTDGSVPNNMRDGDLLVQVVASATI